MRTNSYKENFIELQISYNGVWRNLNRDISRQLDNGKKTLITRTQLKNVW